MSAALFSYGTGEFLESNPLRRRNFVLFLTSQLQSRSNGAFRGWYACKASRAISQFGFCAFACAYNVHPSQRRDERVEFRFFSLSSHWNRFVVVAGSFQISKITERTKKRTDAARLLTLVKVIVRIPSKTKCECTMYRFRTSNDRQLMNALHIR